MSRNYLGGLIGATPLSQTEGSSAVVDLSVTPTVTQNVDSQTEHYFVSIDFNADGSEATYLLQNGRAYTVSLSTAYDLSTAGSLSSLYDIPSGVDYSYSLGFSNDGSRLYGLALFSSTLYYWDLSTAYDVTSAGSRQSTTWPGDNIGAKGVLNCFNDDGSKLFVLTLSQYVYEYALSTAYDLTTASYTAKTDFTSDFTDTQSSIYKLDNSGLRFAAFDNVYSSGKLYRITLTSAYDFSTASISTDNMPNVPSGGSGYAASLGRLYYATGGSTTQKVDAVQLGFTPGVAGSNGLRTSGAFAVGTLGGDGAVGDPYWDDTVLYLRANNVHADETGRHYPQMGTGGYSTSVPFSASSNTHSFNFNNTTAHRITLPNSTDFQFGSGEFTIEAFVRWNGTQELGSLFNTYEGTGISGLFFGVAGLSGGNMRLYCTSNGSTWNMANGADGGMQLTANTWHHVALVRESNGSIYSYLDGTKTTTALSTSTASIYTNGTDDAHIGGNTTNYQWMGQIDEVRITKGVARYTADFTAPTTSFNTSAPVARTRPTRRWGGLVGRSVVTPVLTAPGVGSGYPGLDQPGTRWSIQSDTYAVGTSTGGNSCLYLDMVPTSGKYYVEFYVWNNKNQTIFCGIQSNTIEASYPMSTPGVAYYSPNGNWVNGSGSFQGTGHHPGYFNAKVIGLAIDFDANKTWFHVAGVWANSGDPSSGGAGDSYSNTGTNMTAYVSGNQTSATKKYASINTGNNGTFDGYVAAGGYTDTNGVGDFKYPVPTGFQGWYTSNTAATTTAASVVKTGNLKLSELLQADYPPPNYWSDPSVFVDFANTSTSYIRPNTNEGAGRTTNQFSSLSGWSFARSSVGYHLNSSGNFVEASSGSPRIDHDANGNVKGLLVEGGSSNIIPSSTPYIGSGSHWAINTKVERDSNGNVATTTLLNSTFYKMECRNAGVMALTENGMSIDLQTAGTHTYTASAYIKPSSGYLGCNIRADGNDSNYAEAGFSSDAQNNRVTVGNTQFTTNGTGWTPIDSGVIDVGNGIFRIWFTFSWTYNASSGSSAFNRLRIRGNAGVGESYYISHIQLEKSDKLTSYIRKAPQGYVWNGSALSSDDTNFGTTTGKTRSAETARLDLGSNGWYSGGPVTIMATARSDDFVPSTNQALVSLQDASDNDVRFIMFKSAAQNDKITTQFVNTAGNGGDFQSPSAMPEGQNITAAASFSQNGTAVDVLHTQDGNTATASTKASRTIPTANIDTLVFGGLGTAGALTLNGTIRSAYIWPRALHAEQIEAFTSSTPPYDNSPLS